MRGAYHPHELVAHPSTSATADASLASPAMSTSLSISPDPVPPVWTAKADTDARYNAGVRALVAAVREDVAAARGGQLGLGVLFGTHNWESAGLIVDELVRQGLAVEVEGEGGVVEVGDEVAERVTLGQLYGALCFRFLARTEGDRQALEWARWPWSLDKRCLRS